MIIFVLSVEKDFEGRLVFEYPDNALIKDIKDEVQKQLAINLHDDPDSCELITLNFAGASLDDNWKLGELGLTQGSTLTLKIIPLKKPILFIKCGHNDETLELEDGIDIIHTKISELKTIISNHTGLPVSVFRLVKSKSSTEMYDMHSLWYYKIFKGDTINLQVWDGWKSFLNYCLRGISNKVLSNLSNDSHVQRFQLKVALYIASHYGHVDLAAKILQQGIRADEAVGEHPSRLWCDDGQPKHVGVTKAAVHQAAEKGQLDILRTFIHDNVCVVLAIDGRGLKALNIALRNRHKKCSKFLLTKQWTKVEYSTREMPLYVYHGLKMWGERAREKVSFITLIDKTAHLRKRGLNSKYALVGTDIELDGFTPTRLNSAPADNIGEQKRLQKIQEFQKLMGLYRRNSSDNLENKQCLIKQSKMTLSQQKSVHRRVRSDSNVSIPQQSKHRTGLSLPPIEVNKILQDKQQHSTTDTITTKVNGNTRNNRTDREKTQGEQIVLRPSMGSSLKITSIIEEDENVSDSVSENKPIRKQSYLSTTNHKQNKFNKSSNFTQQKKPPPDIMASNSEPTMTKTKRSSSQITTSIDTRKTIHSSLPSRKMLHRQSTSHSLSENHNTSDHPFILSSSLFNQDPAMQSLETYERYRGIDSRTHATQCLKMASRFQAKPWLQQLDVAMRLAESRVKRSTSFIV